MALKPEFSVPKNAIFTQKRAILTSLINRNPVKLFSNSTWSIGTKKITFMHKNMILVILGPLWRIGISKMVTMSIF